MAAPRDDTNIQKLLAAEKKAQEIVGEARSKRAEKMKRAKQEAEQEIATYRAELEAKFKNETAASTSVSDSTFQELDKDTQQQINAIATGLPTKKKEAVQMLVKYVETVDLMA